MRQIIAQFITWMLFWGVIHCALGRAGYIGIFVLYLFAFGVCAWIFKEASAALQDGNTQNKVLPLAEVLALLDGARVWVEERPREYGLCSAVYVRNGDVLTEDGSSGYYPILGKLIPWGINQRVWLRKPTPDELAANPWPEAPA